MADSNGASGIGEFAWKLLAIIRLINGGLALFAPSWLIRRLEIDPAAQPGMHYVFRMFGVRTIVIGADLWLNSPGRARALRQGILIHGSDTTAAFIAFAFGQLPVRSALTAVGISLVNTMLAIIAAKAYASRD
jgi:hypothetical protein